ncbi:MAG: C4-type zinc ribbon domain-containing protein [Bacteroidales bacterium]|jgi:uncharacterized protein|nr:C4-type zinc ribbon domain-containing protein [Bacteroidales bacterium]
MAKEKKAADPKELSVEEKLKALYKLQTINSTIDEIKLLRGELPLEVQDLEDEIAGIRTRIENFRLEQKAIDTAIAQRKIEISTAQALVDKYKAQQDSVRNNREFDYLSKEIEFQSLEVELCQKKIRDAQADAETLLIEITSSEELLADKTADHEHKHSELETIIEETRQKEEKLREEAKKVETLIEPRLLSAFKRIRKNARNGLAVVTVQRAACGGCFNNIPPQRQLDIRSNKKIIVCEYCGRILVDQELAGITVEKPVKAKATRKKAAPKEAKEVKEETSED